MACNFLNNLFSTCFTIDDGWINTPLSVWNADDVRNFLRTEGYEDWETYFPMYNGRNLSSLTEQRLISELRLDEIRARDLLHLISGYVSNNDTNSASSQGSAPDDDQRTYNVSNSGTDSTSSHDNIHVDDQHNDNALPSFRAVSDLTDQFDEGYSTCNNAPTVNGNKSDSDSTTDGKAEDGDDITMENDSFPVLRGEYSMFNVKRSKDVIESRHICQVLEVPPSYSGSSKIGSFVMISPECFKEPDWLDKSLNYNDQECSDLNKIRIASFNVKCTCQMGDAPKEFDLLRTKISQIAQVICRSGSDIVALQELPFKLNAKGKMPIFFSDVERLLLEALKEETLLDWECIACEAFYQEEKKTKGQDVHAFVFKKNIIRCSRVVKIVHNKDRSNWLQRPLILGFFHNVRFPDNGHFTLCNVHTKPDRAEQEILNIGQIIAGMESIAQGTLIILGDFNMCGTTPHLFNKGDRVKYKLNSNEVEGTVVEQKIKLVYINRDNCENKNADTVDKTKVEYIDKNAADERTQHLLRNNGDDGCNRTPPIPEQNLWSDFSSRNYIPCVVNSCTNYSMDNCYDNIWMKENFWGHHREDPTIRHSSVVPEDERTTFEKNFKNGVFEYKYFLFHRGEQMGMKTSDHNLIFVDIKLSNCKSIDVDARILKEDTNEREEEPVTPIASQQPPTGGGGGMKKK